MSRVLNGDSLHSIVSLLKAEIGFGNLDLG